MATDTAMGSFYQRAAGYGIPGVRINGNDVLEVYAAAKEAVERARRGEGPTFIECDTPKGLMVPGVKDVDILSLPQLSQASKAIINKARNGELKPTT